MLVTRRRVLTGIIAAPLIVKIPGLLMPVRVIQEELPVHQFTEAQLAKMLEELLNHEMEYRIGPTNYIVLVHPTIHSILFDKAVQ